MTRIGLLSDTHGYIDPNIFRHFENVDEIWHAGDFGNIELAEELAAFKPLRGVWGNVDDTKLRMSFPECNVFTIEGLKVLMIHIGGYPGRYSVKARAALLQHRPGLFISGHSHILKIMPDSKIHCLHMNPGAAGKHGWHLIRTIIRFCIDAGKIQDCEVIELGKRSAV
ncbi:MAG: metallophosphoesterase family protein [Bacteroidetes bacterium]|nr:metallophosphoesterase family protein [Bacteroidota bacterium]MBS1628450.1 metallophosphoesterase family protein [Bacteroidota bacterium]